MTKSALPSSVAGNSRPSDFAVLKLKPVAAGSAEMVTTGIVVGKFDPADWKFPPKPRWIRWKTYDRYEEKFDNYGGILNDSLFAKLGGL
jgi:hypothetical protein